MDFDRFAACILLSSHKNMIEDLQVNKLKKSNTIMSKNKFGPAGSKSMELNPCITDGGRRSLINFSIPLQQVKSL